MMYEFKVKPVPQDSLHFSYNGNLFQQIGSNGKSNMPKLLFWYFYQENDWNWPICLLFLKNEDYILIKLSCLMNSYPMKLFTIDLKIRTFFWLNSIILSCFVEFLVSFIKMTWNFGSKLVWIMIPCLSNLSLIQSKVAIIILYLVSRKKNPLNIISTWTS